MAINILIYDDNEALRQSLEALLLEQPDFELLAAMPNAETVESDVLQFSPTVILMDIDMPVINGVEAVKRIRKINQQVPIIILTVFDDNTHIFDAICAGATGYLLKQYASTEIAAAIRNVLQGGAPMTGSVARKVLQMVPQAKTTNQENVNLSAKETAILQLLVKGFSYKMIAAELNISIDTVRFHIKKIYEKLQVHSATEAVSKAINNNLINLLPFLCYMIM